LEGESNDAHLVALFKQVMWDVTVFSEHASGVRLRSYQVDVARAVIDSVMHGRGLTFVVMFPRQSGKNELQAQIEAYLLTLLQESDAEIVKVSPTWKPQSLNAMRRLQRVIERNLLSRYTWRKENGYIYRIGSARIFFLSGEPEANIVGATASTLLEVDEAQDVLPVKFDKDIAPMAASTNATRIFWGTAWTADTLLARELRAARGAEAEDRVRRVFVCTADQVALEVPAYQAFVTGQVARLGRNHPMVKSQFYSEEVDGEAGLFPPARRALMVGTHLRQALPVAGRAYAFTLDVGGEKSKDEGGRRKDEENQKLPNKELLNQKLLNKELPNQELQNNHDATALTIFEVDTSTLSDPLLRAPTYRVVDRRQWVGEKHSTLYAQLLSLAAAWRPLYVVVDATGVGAGLAGFLEKALPGRVIPFVFSGASKSRLGWDFLSVVETGRFKDWYEPEKHWDEQDVFWRQVEGCQGEVIPGPEQRMKWGVAESARDPVSGLPLHDDLLISAALCAVLDGQPWPQSGGTIVVVRRDPLEEMEMGF
jgi:hypothetical protein